MNQSRGRWVAIITGALSVLIGLAYLALITVLDSRGPRLPPPPEALGLNLQTDVAAAVSPADAARVLPPAAGLLPESGAVRPHGG